jgi:hypothetical protein
MFDGPKTAHNAGRRCFSQENTISSLLRKQVCEMEEEKPARAVSHFCPVGLAGVHGPAGDEERQDVQLKLMTGLGVRRLHAYRLKSSRGKYVLSQGT